MFRSAPHNRSRRGLTLIELIIALSIAVILFGAAIVSVGALTGTSAKAAAGELGGTIRSLYDTAALSGKTCRLVFDLPTEESGKPVTYWAECAAGALTARHDRDEELKDADKALQDDESPRARRYSDDSLSSSEELMNAEKDRIESAARFSKFTTSEIEPRSFPSAVTVEVWTRHQRNIAKDGRAFLYFFPQGFTERAQIYVRQGNNVWTLLVSPLTGKTKVVNDEVEVPKV